MYGLFTASDEAYRRSTFGRTALDLFYSFERTKYYEKAAYGTDSIHIHPVVGLSDQMWDAYDSVKEKERVLLFEGLD